HTTVRRTITISIPAGIDTGMRLRMDGYGEAGEPGAPNGDLFIEVQVIPDKRFIRTGDNLETEVTISPAEAAIGSRKEIKTIEEKIVDLKIPAGVQHGTALKIPGEGVRRRGRPGDLLVRVKIVVPKRLTEEEKELYAKIIELESQKNSSKKGFFKDVINKVKDNL
ncbi:MAG: J domain-containing protein, partial [Methanogenium sp.]|nr:J domain-containing protein [Methanogenium sp.]